MEFILCLSYSLLFFFIIKHTRFFKKTGIKPGILFFFFLLKVIAGVALTAYYKNHYGGGDMFSFFDDAKIIHNVRKQNGWNYMRILTGINDGHPDLIKHYNQMTSWKRPFAEGPFSNNSTIIRFNAWSMLFSFQNFYVHTVFICILSFTGQVALYKAMALHTRTLQQKIMQAVFFLTPSLLMWSSVVLKEGLVVFSMGLLIYSVQTLSVSQFSLKHIIITILSFLLLLYTKYFLAFIIGIPLLAFYIVNKFSLKKQLLSYGILFSISIITGWYLTTILTQQKPSDILYEQQKKSMRFAKGGLYLIGNNNIIILPPVNTNCITEIKKGKLYNINEGCSYERVAIEDFERRSIVEKSAYDTTTYRLYQNIPASNYIVNLPLTNGGIKSILKAIPFALLNALIHPSLTQIDSIETAFVSIENLLILIFIILCFFFAGIKPENINLLLLSLSIAVSLLILFGLTTPVTGTLVRYKSIVLPFMLSGTILLINEGKVFNKFPILKKWITK